LVSFSFFSSVRFSLQHDDSLGNPLLLRAPLDAGVRVIAAHCASEGQTCICGHEVSINKITKERQQKERSKVEPRRSLIACTLFCSLFAHDRRRS
jgi:hypothetical protein